MAIPIFPHMTLFTGALPPKYTTNLFQTPASRESWLYSSMDPDGPMACDVCARDSLRFA